MNKLRLRSYLLLILVTAIWGIAGPVIKYTLPNFPPSTFLTYRFLISSLILVPIAWVMKPKFPKSKREKIILTIVALLGSSINLGFTFWALNYTTVLDAIIIGNSAPIMVIIGGVIFLKEKVSKKEIAGILTVILGTSILVIQPFLENESGYRFNILGNLLMLGANATWAAYVIISKEELNHKVDTLLMTSYMFVLGFITTLPLAILETKGVTNLLYLVSTAPFKAHLGVWYMAVFSGALAYFLYQEGQKNIEASEATVFGYLGPIFAMPLAVFWLHEVVSTPFVIGAIVIAVGVFIAEYKKVGKK